MLVAASAFWFNQNRTSCSC